ncbi:MAG TPA: 30S ribosomal protein S20 [Polyangia bacterium]
MGLESKEIVVVANIKSSEKANRQRITRTARNVAQKTAMRSVVKRLRAAIGHKNATEAKNLLASAIQAIDRAESKGVIKKGTASRSVSRLTLAVARLK